MTCTRGARIDGRTAPAAGALAIILALACAGCGDDSAGVDVPGGRGALVSPFAEIATCVKAVYRGPATQLYSNRPYHTAKRVDAAVGLSFCRGARHGADVWIVEVAKPTTFVAFGTPAFGLERRGWMPSEAELLVAAAGVALDRVYSKRFAPGRYVIRQAFARTAPVVLWDDATVQLVR